LSTDWHDYDYDNVVDNSMRLFIGVNGCIAVGNEAGIKDPFGRNLT